jgi:hypothetical protein
MTIAASGAKEQGLDGLVETFTAIGRNYLSGKACGDDMASELLMASKMLQAASLAIARYGDDADTAIDMAYMAYENSNHEINALKNLRLVCAELFNRKGLTDDNVARRVMNELTHYVMYSLDADEEKVELARDWEKCADALLAAGQTRWVAAAAKKILEEDIDGEAPVYPAYHRILNQLGLQAIREAPTYEKG